MSGILLTVQQRKCHKLSPADMGMTNTKLYFIYRAFKYSSGARCCQVDCV